MTVPSSIAANKSFIAAFGTVVSKTGTKSLNAQYVSAWGGMSSGLQIFGMLTAGQTSDRFGRKLNLAFVCMFLSVAIVLELCAKNWIYFLMARGLAGWGTGMAKATLTCYVAEIAPSGLRGSILTMYSFMYALGQFSCAIALEIVQLKSLSWRNAFFAEIVFLALYVPVAIFAPESPWYYANKYDHDGAKRMLLKINGNVPGYDAEHEYAVIAAEVEHNAALAAKSAAVSWSETFKGINGRRTWVSFLPLTTQQLVGSPFVFSYLSYFFSIAGVSNPFLPTVASNTILLGGLVVAAFTVDKLGRRPLLLVSETINMVTILFMGMIGTFSKRNDGTLSSTQSNAIVALACIWVAAYSMGPAPLGENGPLLTPRHQTHSSTGYAYAAETSTPVLRAKTTALATAMCGAFALAFTYCTPIMLSAQEANWGIEGVGYFYACLAFIGLIGLYFTVPEVGFSPLPEFC